MYRSIKFISIYILFGAISCTKTQKSNTLPESQTNHNKAPNNHVIISGRADDIEALDFLNIIDGTYYFGKNEGDTLNKTGDSVVLLLNNIRKSQISDFTANSNTNLYKTKLFLNPGDSIHFTINNGNLKFFGPNSELNNFYHNLYKETPSYKNNPYYSDIYSYKENTISIYNEKIK
ncbi:hypothetical protein [Mangrovimonas sp. DI 80]|uniref:hypothetical protein n=1 Tax=Mangrovimonas sp. DI 80 TaxID=1779330 RepID=UPI0009761D8E|nr:hypothetical protein [Mangrovimonas sp. DI 80]OMP31898.1 hypothetical protein BKM32_02220 [Mangrovimonas sp. DI 80]